MKEGYKQQVASSFDRRARSYDESPFHCELARRLLGHAELRPGERVLDVATGTGLVAVPAAQLVGPGGFVTGIDLSEGMLNQARQSAAELGVTNVGFERADADTLTLDEGRFDAILCCSALVYLTDIPRALRSWYRALRSGGRVAFTCFADTAFSVPKLLRELAAEYGVRLPNPNAPCGSLPACRELVAGAGFSRYTVHTETLSYAWRLPNPEAAWPEVYGPFDEGLGELDEADLHDLKRRYLREVTARFPAGGWLEPVPTFFVLADKVP